MSKKLLVTLILVLVWCAVTLPVMADNGPVRWTSDQIAAAAQEAGITADQINTIKSAWYAGQKTAIQLNADLGMKALDLNKALDASNPDDNTVLSLVQAIGDLRTKIELNQVQFVLKVKDVLTDEQELKLNAIVNRAMSPQPSPASAPKDNN
jgi:Spy/CpxP family protein refolding chaperone